MTKRTGILIILLTLFFAADAYAQARHVTGYRILKPTESLMEMLKQRKIDITGIEKDKYVEIYDYEELAEEIRRMGFRVEFAIPQNALPEGYITYSGMRDTLLQLQAMYPEIMKVDSLGASVQGRGMWSVKISDNVNFTEDETRFLVVASYHGDEIINVEVAMHQLQWLVENYGTDPEATDYVDSFELYFMPMINPDGRMFNPPMRRNMNGVDLNRNHSIAFFPTTNHGAHPFSEPETKAVRKLAESVHFDGSISYHSSGDDVLRPWGFDNYRLTPDEDFFVKLGHEMAVAMNYDYLHPYLYKVEGEFGDYMYGIFGTPTFTMETYIQKISVYDPVVPMIEAENLISFKMFLNRLKGPGVTGLITDAFSGEPVETIVEVVNFEDYSIMKARRADKDFGRYNRFLEPGTYSVIYRDNLHYPELRNITISENEPLQVLNIAMYPKAYTVVLNLIKLDGISNIGTGNGNGLLNPAEEVEINIELVNYGAVEAAGIYAVISSEDTAVAITNSVIPVGSISPGERFYTSENFMFTVSSGVLPGHPVNFNVSVYDDSGFVSGREYTEQVQGMYDNAESEGFDSWKHGYIYGLDDWRKGETLGKGSDPAEAHAGAGVWGNDLGAEPDDGLYWFDSHNYLQTPPVDCTGWDRVYLQFYRWLGKAAGDSAYITLNNEVVWSSPAPQLVVDTEWSVQTIDISSIAADNDSVVIRFGLVTDGSVLAGGWTLDDILVYEEPLFSTGAITFPGSGSSPAGYRLFQNFPNPFNNDTIIRFKLAAEGRVKLVIYNVLGQKVRMLADADYPVGSYSVRWDGSGDDGSSLSSGVYFYRLETPDFKDAKKMLLIR